MSQQSLQTSSKLIVVRTLSTHIDHQSIQFYIGQLVGCRVWAKGKLFYHIWGLVNFLSRRDSDVCSLTFNSCGLLVVFLIYIQVMNYWTPRKKDCPTGLRPVHSPSPQSPHTSRQMLCFTVQQADLQIAHPPANSCQIRGTSSLSRHSACSSPFELMDLSRCSGVFMQAHIQLSYYNGLWFIVFCAVWQTSWIY